MRPSQAELLVGDASCTGRWCWRKLAHARESVWISTANVKAMYVEQGGRFDSVLDALLGAGGARGGAAAAARGAAQSRPFRAAFDKRQRLVRGGLLLKVCPRVHFKTVLVDGAWSYLGSANLTGAGLGAKGEDKRNFEMGFVTEDFDVIDRVTALYESVWSGAECRACKLRELCPDPIGEAAPRKRAARARDDGGVELGKAKRLWRP